MLVSNSRSQSESVVVELFKESLINLLVEISSSNNNFDEKVFNKFKSIFGSIKENSTNSLSECHALYKIVSGFKVNGKDLDQLDLETVKNGNKKELSSNLQLIYNNVKLFSDSLRPQNSSLLLVG